MGTQRTQMNNQRSADFWPVRYSSPPSQQDRREATRIAALRLANEYAQAVMQQPEQPGFFTERRVMHIMLVATVLVCAGIPSYLVLNVAFRILGM